VHGQGDAAEMYDRIDMEMKMHVENVSWFVAVILE